MMSNITEKIDWKAPLIIVIGVAALWGVSGVLLYDLKDRGTFGDMFGAANALFSGLAFGGIIYAILLQRKELELQRKELELTRDELEGQKLQLQAQNETLKKQNFENTFFQLLQLQNQIINSTDLIDPQDSTRITKGRDCFEIFYRRLVKRWGQTSSQLPPHSRDIDKIRLVYDDFYPQHQSEIGHYFRNLYTIIKFVDSSEIGEEKKYTNIVRAQLSTSELALLFYNCISDQGSEKFKPLIERYSLLKNLPTKVLIDPVNHERIYHPSAFGK